MRRTICSLIAANALIAAALVAPTSTSATTPAADVRIGALFFPSILGLLPTLGGPHYCSASVIHSSTENLIITAAHCVYGSTRNIEQVTGAFTLAGTPTVGTPVTVTGYPSGSGGPVSCATTTSTTTGCPTIACPGFVDGTSGGPWVHANTIVGVIGGLHEGGCTAGISYSSPFDASTIALLSRAERGGHRDSPFPPLSDGC